VAVAVGDVYAFTAARRWFALQVIREFLKDDWQLVVFATPSTKQPTADIIDGAPIYVLRRARPHNMPLHVHCQREPPSELTFLGNRPVALAFDVPRRFRSSPKLGEDTLPMWTTWTYPRDCIKEDLAKQPPPYRSRRFPGWTTMDPRASRAIDAAVTKFATAKPATAKAAEAALRRAVKAANRHEASIDTIAREELDAALVKIARKWKLDAARAAEIIDATRDW
jgi:hypothetical protein